MTQEEPELEAPTLLEIREPREGLPEVVDTNHALQRAVKSLTQGVGPVAIDAERASGFRYGQRAYLVQLNRKGSGIHLIDPTNFPNLAPIQQALDGVDWILHAASQDLVCLAEVGLKPTALLFDTELAGRILGLPKVGLGTLVETQLGISLAKEHSAADWSKRPLPTDWLNYAALDVEFLHDLWDVLSKQLHESAKYDYAMAEFANVRDNTRAIERVDPWRRTSGLHGARNPRTLAIVRALWEARESLAKQKDLAPGRILPDSLLVQIALSALESPSNFKALEVWSNRLVARHRASWVAAVEDALALPEQSLPPTKIVSNGPPAPRLWADRNPEAFAKLEQVRSDLANLSESTAIPVENLMLPDIVRRILWTAPTDEASVPQILSDMGARQWQIGLVAPIITRALFSPLNVTEPEGSSEH